MKFKRRDDWHALSACGRYSLTPYDAPNGSGCVIAWRVRDEKWGLPRWLGVYYWQNPSGKESAQRIAIKACEADAGVSA